MIKCFQIKRIAILVFGLAMAVSVAADTLIGKVVKVADGDTLTLLSAGQQYRVRFAQIDAPEKKQPYGQAAKRWLTDRVAGQTVTVEYSVTDRYGRIVGEVYAGHQLVNVELVREGLAWVYDRYATDSSLYTLQAEAKANKRGLWADPDPVAPWVWRKLQRQKDGKP